MIFQPKHIKKTEGVFRVPQKVCAVAHPCLQRPVLRELWEGFTLGTSVLTAVECDAYLFSVGGVKPLPPDGEEYSIRIEPHGVSVYAETEKNLIRGFMTLLDRLTAAEQGGKTVMEAECCEILDSASIGCRMVHFCVFPETATLELRRLVRLAAALRYTHIILEFWGTLRYDCLRELSWPQAPERDEIRRILTEARELGLEIVPMFNHWGHASGSRIMHGKHVVLDQSPALATYFSEDGWCWDIRKPRVRALLRRIRAELCELCGEGSYFHVGCDEAFGFDFTEESMDFITDFLNEISDEMKAKGRRIIAWGDMLLARHPHYSKSNIYTCNAPSPEAEQSMLTRLKRDIVIADWQYDAVHAPVETASVFKRAGFDTLLCPYDKGVAQLDACVDTAREEGLLGILHTTWHTLSSGMPFVLLCAVRCLEEGNRMPQPAAYTKTAALLRHVMPAHGSYERAGWSREQVGFRW